MIIAVFAVLILLQLGAREFTESKAAKNVLTVMAVLSVLPMANVASPFLAAFRYKSLSDDEYRKYSAFEGKCSMVYELIVTTKDFLIAMDAAAVHPTGVYCWCTNPKLDLAAAEKAINETFKEAHLDPNVKLIKDQAAFDRRLENLKPASQYEDDGTMEYAVRLLKAISM